MNEVSLVAASASPARSKRAMWGSIGRASRAGLCGALLALCAEAGAQPLDESYSGEELVDILRGDGYSSVELRSDSRLVIRIDGRNYQLINNDDGDLQLYHYVSGDGITPDLMNEWNRTKRLSRAYVDGDGDAVIEADLLANAGITEAHVTEFLDVFLVSTRAFRDYVGSK